MKEEKVSCDDEEIFKKNLIARLNRIIGQVNGIERMMGNGSECDEILNQISSIKSALNGIIKAILEAHLKSCVVSGIKSKNKNETVNNLISILDKLLDIPKCNKSKGKIFEKIKEQLFVIKEKIEKGGCHIGVLEYIAIIKYELYGTSKIILHNHIKNCMVRDISLGLEDETITDFLYTINKMIK